MKRRQTPAGRPESARNEARDREDPDPAVTDEPESTDEDSSGIRLNKFLAQNGVASRRGADTLIAKGQVQVDGRVVTELGTRIDPATSRVEVGGVVLQP